MSLCDTEASCLKNLILCSQFFETATLFSSRDMVSYYFHKLNNVIKFWSDFYLNITLKSIHFIFILMKACFRVASYCKVYCLWTGQVFTNGVQEFLSLVSTLLTFYTAICFVINSLCFRRLSFSYPATILRSSVFTRPGTFFLRFLMTKP